MSAFLFLADSLVNQSVARAAEKILNSWRFKNGILNILETGTGYLSLFCVALLYLLFGHYHTGNPGGHGLLLPFNAASWIPMFILIGVGFCLVARNKILYFSELSVYLFFSGMLLSLPLLYLNASIPQSVLRIIGVWAGWLVFLSLQQFRLNINQVLLLLVLILGGVWIEGIRYWLLMIDSYLSTGRVVDNYVFGLYGVFQQANVFASFAATGAVIAGYLITQYKEQKFGNILLVLYLLTPVLLYQIFVSSASRAGWYGVSVGTVLLLPYMYRRVPKIVFSLWLLAWVAGYAISQLLIEAGGFVVSDKNILSFVGPRSYIFLQAIQMFLSKPFFGFGYGNFEYSYVHFIADQYAIGKATMPPLAETFHPHNEFLFWMVEGGIVPIVGLLLAAWAVWRAVYKLELLERLAVIGLFFPLALHSQVEFPFYASVMHWIAFIILIYCVDAKTGVQKKRPLTSGKPALAIGILIPSLATWFLVTTIQTGIIYSRFMELQAPLTSFTSVSNAVVWRNHLNWAINSSALTTGRELDRPDLIHKYIDWAPDILAQQPRPIFYEYLVLAYLSLNETGQADTIIEEFRHLFPGRVFSVITVN